MQFKYGFYIHHHGSGHVTRAVSIANSLPYDEVVFFGSDLEPYKTLIPAQIHCIHLPIDTPMDLDNGVKNDNLSFLHYAPLNIAGIAQRNLLLTTFFAQNRTCMLVVDVSVEITLLARLCGIPTIVVRQHGDRRDTAHTLAYESAELIVAPYSESLSFAHDEGRFASKTFFSGGFSRFGDSTDVNEDTILGNIAVFIGRGGSCFDDRFITHLRGILPAKYTLHILGELSRCGPLPGLIYYGHSTAAKEILKSCEVVICNAGHNCVMEVGSLRKRMICVPAERPFDEQLVKAMLLQREGVALVVRESELYNADWETLIVKAKNLSTLAWNEMMNPSATEQIADRLKQLHKQLFEHRLEHVQINAYN
ncbi:glycosyltransferase [Sphingobacterium haloxyli]|uniref:Glycosyl transferase family 28 C-terminal domain-containing protein n=1 Tax=Sphingobacterium haloxyli TaxID=2100533 RepID=A0A2S9J4H7_9SPHI|nr:glycosyltransferase [Sphingobacterium haloxyli]PRD47675.1 hypothetical protein C5745_10265 [Sphingobacterium haloxyli]